MISARDELLHLVDCLSNAECERALELLSPLRWSNDESVKIHPPDEDLPKLGELRGLLKGSLGDQTSVEFVRSIRDEQAEKCEPSPRP